MMPLLRALSVSPTKLLIVDFRRMVTGVFTRIFHSEVHAKKRPDEPKPRNLPMQRRGTLDQLRPMPALCRNGESVTAHAACSITHLRQKYIMTGCFQFQASRKRPFLSLR